MERRGMRSVTPLGDASRDGYAAAPGELALGRRSPRHGTGWPVAVGLGCLWRIPGWLLAGVVYLVLAVVLWWHVWSGHPASTMTCDCGDPPSFVWFLAWPAYAISHGHSLFFTTRVHVPGGMNLLDNTSVLALGVLLAPVTWLFGPVASLNVALTAAPALTALSAYGCVRRALGLSRPAAFLAGLLFGFSPFMLRNEAANHLQTSFLALLPLIFWCCYELAVAQRGKWWRWGLGLGLLIALQFFVGLEMLVITALTAVLALFLGFLAALLRQGTLSAKLPFAWRGFLVAAAIAGTLLAYPLWFALAGPEHIRGPNWWHARGNSLAQVLTPIHPNAGLVSGYLGPVGAFEGYLGISALAVLALAVVVVRRPMAKLCAVMTVMVVWLSFGSPKRHESTGLASWLLPPWRAVDHLPVLNKLTPATFSAAAVWFVVVAGALLVDQLVRPRGPGARSGAGSAQAVTPGGVRSGPSAGQVAMAAAVSVALVVPWLFSWRFPYTTRPVATASWATHVGAKLPSDAVVLVYPFPASPKDQALIWQADSEMRYALVGGRGIVAGKSGAADHGMTRGTPEGMMSDLSTSSLPRYRQWRPPSSATVRWFRSALRHWGVTSVVMTAGGRDPAYARRWLTAVLGTTPQREYGAWVWNAVRKLTS